MTSQKPEPAVAGNLRLLHVAVLLAATLIGVVHLPRPFYGDQAGHLVFAMRMHQGAVLYRDIWDVKQPAIFGWYLMAGNLFGFNEVGIHSLELLYFLAFGVLLLWLLRRYYTHSWTPSVTVLLFFFFYYCATGITHQTQIEGLVGPPMFVAIWFASLAVEKSGDSKWLWFLAGLSAAVVFFFKFLFLGIVLPSWLALLLRKNPDRLRDVLAASFPALAGFLSFTALVCFYFWSHGALRQLAENLIVYPSHAVHQLACCDWNRLLRSVRWFVNSFSPLIAFAVFGIWATAHRKYDPLTAGMLLWLATGSCVFFIQSNAWWEYHFMLLLVPLVVLAARGIESFYASINEQFGWSKGRGAAVLAMALVILCSPELSNLGMRTLMLARYNFVRDSDDRVEYQGHDTLYNESFYPKIMNEVRVLQGRPQQGPIWVCDDPLYYYLSGRMPAVQQNLQADYLLPEQWKQLENQLQQSPPSQIFVRTEYIGLLRSRSPRIQKFIAQNYSVLHTSDAGTWYELQPDLSARSRVE
jgi:hypothetical protein